MSTAVAAPPSTSTPTLASSVSVEPHVSPRHFAPIAPSAHHHATASAPAAAAATAAAAAEPPPKRPRASISPRSAERPATGGDTPRSNGERSPNSLRSGPPPMIKVKKEPTSPTMPTSKRRPNRLDLSASGNESGGPHTSRPSAGPLTSQQSAGLSAIHDVGLACLSPGFQTHDPAMREQLQRSLDVRDQQRQIIEARQKGKGGASPSGSDNSRPQDSTLFGVPTKAPMTSRRKGPPPGLAINAPSASQFANERVIQSAPMHQTFTGLNNRIPHGPSGLGNTSHIHHVPAQQTNNRLPPIADVFAHDRLEGPRGFSSPGSHPNGHPPPVPSPSFPPPHHQQQMHPLSARTREFRSAEEAVQSMSGGRDDLMPKVVHYGGVQPPTPPSPMPPGGGQHHHHHHQHHQSHPALEQPHHVPPPLHSSHSDPHHRPDILGRTASMNGRRRGREEYERDNGSPPNRFNSQQDAKRATFATAFRPDSRDDEGDWRAGMSGAEKREEFLRLCERAWDLFHS